MGARRKALVVAALIGAIIVTGMPQPAAASQHQVEFRGSGWGHGVGMSQYGAHAMAVTGHSYPQILAHYYRGTSISLLPTNATIWVNLEERFVSKTLTVHPTGASPAAPVQVSLGSQQVSAEGGAAIELAIHGANGCVVKVTNPGSAPQALTDDGHCTIDFRWYDWQSTASPTTKIQIEECTLPDWNASPTVHRPCQYARGQLHLRGGTGGLYLSAQMRMEDYVLGISEVPFGWSAHALRAQAVAARTYAEARKRTRGTPTAANNNGCWCHVRDTTADQRYVGWGHSNAGPWINATNATARQVLTHPASNLGVITAFYSSSSGGRTEHGHLKGFSSSPVEWLTSVDDIHAVNGTVFNPNASWTRTVSTSAVAAAVGFDSVTSVRVSATRAGSGSASQIEIKGVKDGQQVEATRTSTWARLTFGLLSEYFTVNYTAPPSSQVQSEGDEIFFYRKDGLYRYYAIRSDATLPSPILAGSNYTRNWDAITSVDLDGDGLDEMFFYRKDGLYRYYNIRSDGTLGSPILAGNNYTRGWDVITSVDLNGNGRDAMLFYRKDGLFRYYNVRPDGTLGLPLLAGSNYTRNWDVITAVDLNGDGKDALFFYRKDGLYRYYNVRPDGTLGSPILAGNNYTRDWDVITAIDLNGDGKDAMFFYRKDGLYRYYNIRPDGTLPTPMRAGSNYTRDWDTITSVNLR